MPDLIVVLFFGGFAALGGIAVFSTWYLSAKNIVKRRLRAAKSTPIARAQEGASSRAARVSRPG